MEQKNRSVIIGAVTILVVAIIIGSVFFLIKNFRNQTASQSEQDALNSLSQAKITPRANNNSGTSSSTISNTVKTYLGTGFKLTYPATWGILTCSNSKNIELDPSNSTDSTNIACDRALKPITLLEVNTLSCPGQTVKIGNYQVVKSKETKDDGVTTYRWCVNLSSKNLDITHRVSANGTKSSSKQDFSAVIEQIISNLQSVAGS